MEVGAIVISYEELISLINRALEGNIGVYFEDNKLLLTDRFVLPLTGQVRVCCFGIRVLFTFKEGELMDFTVNFDKQQGLSTFMGDGYFVN